MGPLRTSMHIEKLIALLQPAIDALLRPWRRPDDLLAALAEHIENGVRSVYSEASDWRPKDALAKRAK